MTNIVDLKTFQRGALKQEWRKGAVVMFQWFSENALLTLRDDTENVQTFIVATDVLRTGQCLVLNAQENVSYTVSDEPIRSYKRIARIKLTAG